MKRLAALVSAALALAVAVAAAQALQAPPAREPLAPIELPTTATRDGDEAARPANVTATPDRTGPEVTPAPAMQPSADDDRTERRTPTRSRWSPAPSLGDGDDDDYEDEDHGDDD